MSCSRAQRSDASEARTLAPSVSSQALYHCSPKFNVNVLKLEIRIANREDPDQTASEKQPDLGQRCLSRHFCRATSVLPAKSDSDVMFCLQSYQGLRIDRSLDGMIGLIHK